MGRLMKYTRRAFLVGSATIAGGVAFGVYQTYKTLPNPLAPKEGEATLNPYVLIDAQGVTIITPRAEMGQGTQSTLAALVAEELDVALADIRTLHGPAAAAYYNGAVADIILPVAEYAKTKTHERIGRALDFLPKMMALHMTGGSTAMRDGFEKMRHAGASARETLKEAAAQKHGLTRRQLSTENGAVRLPDGTLETYIDLAPLAAQLDPIDADLRPKSEWKILGKPTPRTDQLGKATGTTEFGIDTQLDGMKYAAIRHSPRFGAKLKTVDDSTARGMPGVEDVLQMEDAVAVVATNTWLAFQAADALEIEWEEAQYPKTTDALMARISESFADAPNSTLRDDGDVDATLGAAKTVVEAEYQLPFLAHTTMEPMNATALLKDGKMQLWCGNQAPIIHEDKVAKAVGLSSEDVTMHTTFLGGGFGRRVEWDYSLYAARIAAKHEGTPIKLTYTREEDIRHDFYRPGTIARFKGSVENGTATALDVTMAGPSVTQSAMGRLGVPAAGPDKGHVEGLFDQPYGIENYRVNGILTQDMGIPLGFWRSVGHSHNGFFHESFIDELAHAAGVDPFAFRRDLIRKEHEPSARVLEEAAKMANWTGKTPDGIGRGIAFNHSFGTPVAEVIEVQDQGDGIRITKAWIAADPGTALNPQNIEAQLSSGLVYGLSAAIYGEITFDEGEVQEGNFPDYDALRIGQMPKVEVAILENNAGIGGIGEPGTPASLPALANAIFDLTGTRPRRLPLMHDFDFA